MSAPTLTPVIWARQASRDAWKVGSMTAMAPSMAKISLSPVPPKRPAMTMASSTAAAVLMVRRPMWTCCLFTALPTFPAASFDFIKYTF